MTADLKIVPATSDDLDQIVSMTRRTRRQLAAWAPVYFNPGGAADELHAGFLGFSVDSDDHVTQAIVSDEVVVGFFTEIAQSTLTWVDDLCTTDEALWPGIIGTVAEAVDGAWATCVSTKDSSRAAALEAHGRQTISSYWARSTDDVKGAESSAQGPVDVDLGLAPRHTFGGRPFDPSLPGALAFATNDGYVIGSPSATPPIYDPGGPTAVVDQVIGSDRWRLVRDALMAAAGRGDAQVVIVVGANDSELADVASDAGFTRVVDFIGAS